MGFLITFIIAVAAGVTCHLICKWLDGKINGTRPK